MKLRLNTFVNILIFVTVVNSQIPNNYGLKLGYIRSTQNWNYLIKGFSAIEDKIQPRIGLKIGLYSGWEITSHYGFMLEVYFSQKGSIMILEGTDEKGEVAWTTDRLFPVDYIEIPLLLSLNTKLNGVSFYCLFGPRMDYLYYGKAFDYSLQDGLKDVNWDYTLAFGFKIHFFRAPLLLEIRYNPDKTVMHKSKNLEIRNSTIDMIIGVNLTK